MALVQASADFIRVRYLADDPSRNHPVTTNWDADDEFFGFGIGIFLSLIALVMFPFWLRTLIFGPQLSSESAQPTEEAG